MSSIDFFLQQIAILKNGLTSTIALTLAERRANERVCGEMAGCLKDRGSNIESMIFHHCLEDMEFKEEM